LNDPKYRFFRIAAFALIILALFDLGLRFYFHSETRIFRNVSKGNSSLPYLFEVMDRHKGTTIAFLGSSVMQGYINCGDREHFPYLVGENLRKAGIKRTRTINLASAGNHFGDDFCLLYETLKHKPDLVIIEVHFKLFSTYGEFAKAISHEDNTYYIRDYPERDKLLEMFQIGNSDYRQILFENAIKRVWAFYRYKDMVTDHWTDSSDPPAFLSAQSFLDTFDFTNYEAKMARRHNPETHDQEYLWKVLPENLINRDISICNALDTTQTSVNWVILKMIAELGKQHKQKMIFYFSPVNRAFIDQYQLFDMKKLDDIKMEAAHIALEYGHYFLDYTNVVKPAFFSDTDHINRSGHRQVAERMSGDILKRFKPRAKKKD